MNEIFCLTYNKKSAIIIIAIAINVSKNIKRLGVPYLVFSLLIIRIYYKNVTIQLNLNYSKKNIVFTLNLLYNYISNNFVKILTFRRKKVWLQIQCKKKREIHLY